MLIYSLLSRKREKKKKKVARDVFDTFTPCSSFVYDVTDNDTDRWAQEGPNFPLPCSVSDCVRVSRV